MSANYSIYLASEVTEKHFRYPLLSVYLSSDTADNFTVEYCRTWLQVQVV